MIIKNIQKDIHQLKQKYYLLIINMDNLLILRKEMKNIITYILIIIKTEQKGIILKKMKKLK